MTSQPEEPQSESEIADDPDRLVPLLLESPHVKRFDSEPLLGLPMGDGRFRLRSTPYLSADFARNDVVVCDESGDDPPRVRDVGLPSGHSTLQILFAHALPEPELESLVHQLKDYGARAIEANQRYYAIDVGFDGNYRAVVAQAQFWEKRAMAQFATDDASIGKLSFALLDEPLIPWAFDVDPDTPVLTVKQILEDFAPVRHAVAATRDGPWQFLGWDTPTEDDARAVRLIDLVRRDPSLARLADLPPGWHAWREGTADAWERGPLETE